MSRIFAPLSLFVILAFLAIIPVSFAQVGPKNGDTWEPDLARPARPVAAPLVVTDVVVDKTADNPVIAREQAIAESRRAAFQKLAEQNLSPAELKAFSMPKDADIAMLVQDFEIQNEQMSATRYVGTFTVRFRDAVRNYIHIRAEPPPLEENHTQAGQPLHSEEYGEEAQQRETARRPPLVYGRATDAYGDLRRRAPAQDAEPIAQTVIILPYFENIAGQTLLWEEQNAWLRMWQNALPKSPANGRQFFVPLGDIGDIAAGASNGVWSGDYAAVETLMRNYGAEQAVMAVANKSGPSLTIDIYTYSHGRLRRRDTLQPYTGDAAAAEAFRKGVFETIAYLQAPQAPRRGGARAVEDISREVAQEMRDFDTVVIDGQTQGARKVDMSRPLVMQPEGLNATPMMRAPAMPQAGGATRIEATMQFSDPGAWMDMQRRVLGLQPPVRVDISSLSANSVSFTLSSDAPPDVLKQSLYARGIELHPPAMEGGAQGRPVYDVRLAPAARP